MSVKIDQAFISDFQGQSFGLPIAYENAGYEPTPGTEYVALWVFQNTISPADLDDTDEVTGVFQFTLRYPEGKGAIPAKAMADTIFAAYPAGRRITYSGQAVTITGKERVEAMPEDGWFKVVGRLYFTAGTAR